MMVASYAQDRERAAVEQRFRLDLATERLDDEIFAPTDDARQYLNTGDATYRILHQRDAAALRPLEERTQHVLDEGAVPAEIAALKDAMRWADTLLDEQQAAIVAHDKGDDATARKILFGAEYEREMDRAKALLERFQDQLDRRTDTEVVAAVKTAKTSKTISEIALAITGLLFLCVLYFVFKQRVLKPVLRLSDIVNRLAEGDYAVSPPHIDQIDEIGDMAQAIATFRDNGLARQRLEEERDADRRFRDLISRMTQRMQGCDTSNDLKQIIGRFVPEIAPAFPGRLYLIDPTRNVLLEACSWLNPRNSRDEFPAADCWALRRGLPHRPAGALLDAPCNHLDQGDGPAPDTLCLPLSAHGELSGLLYFECSDAHDAAETPEIYLAMLAENIGLALANLRLRDQLRVMAMGDALTGLSNRRQLDATLEQVIAQSQRDHQPISCIMLDLDHFKHINDSFGHDAGDAVLREIGAILRGVVREKELVFRYGGEEFMVLLPGVDTPQATERAEEMRERIAALLIIHDATALGAICASAGVATAPHHCFADRLVQTADAALLRAKSQGRNRVIVATARETENIA